MAVCNILDFGAVADAKTLNTQAVQAALDTIAAKGGGKVVVPAGTYLTGTVFLRDHVELHLEQGARLLGSPDLADYNADDAYPTNWGCKPEGWNAKHLVIAYRIQDASITGPGTINGNGHLFFADEIEKGHVLQACWRNGGRNSRDFENCGRPGQMIVFIECVDVTVRDLAIRDSTCWSLFFHGCRDVQVRGVRIENDILNKNTDGIDIDSCANVVIADCLIRTGDDAITLRGVDRLDRLAADAPSRICENVVVSNCVCSVSATAMRIGVGNGTIRHVLISNLMVAHAGIGLHIQSSYSGEGKGVAISDIRFANIDIRDCSSPVYVVGGTAFATSPVRNISFRGLTGEGFMPITVRGSGDKASGRTRPAHIRFEDVRLVIQGDAPALLVEHADDIHFANVRAERPDGTPIPTERLIKSEDATVEIVSGTPKRAGAQAD